MYTDTEIENLYYEELLRFRHESRPRGPELRLTEYKQNLAELLISPQTLEAWIDNER
jgi:hypothetical protein